ncbi:MAG: AbrB/MazE/SpoVT family DNA-binding domain-containing protein [Thermoproteota archaeon]
MRALSVEVGKYGRIVLPKEIRDKYNVNEGSRLIIRERGGEIVLIPVRRYEKPTEALYGSVWLEKPVEEPKKAAREYVKGKLAGEFI